MSARHRIISTAASPAILLASSVTNAQHASFASLNGRIGLPLQRFDIDQPHSAVEFSARFMGLSTVRGAFASFGGTLMYDAKSIPESSVSVVIVTKRINQHRTSRQRPEESFDGKPSVHRRCGKPLLSTYHCFCALAPETVNESASDTFRFAGPL
jgi:YceI-like protein